MIIFMDLELTFILMGKDIKDNYMKVKEKEMEFVSMLMVHVMMDNGKIIKSLEMDSKIIPMEAYMLAQQIANDKLEAAFDIAVAANEVFAKNNNIKLIDQDSKTAEKLEKASEVFKFYNQIYLVFFKPYKQEIYLIEAQSKGDINAMKQNQESLSKLSKDAKEKLKGITAYRGNTTLKSSCTDLLDFYIMEADTKVPSLIEFYLKKEKFDKLKTAMDKKGKNPSEAEVNEFNAAVNDYNKASNDYNKINNELNNKRSSYLNSWNNAVSNYLDKNVSKKK